MIDNRKIILMYKKETFPLESDTLLENLKTKGNFRKYFEVKKKKIVDHKIIKRMTFFLDLKWKWIGQNGTKFFKLFS